MKTTLLLALLPSLALAQFQDYDPQNPSDYRRCEGSGYSLYQCGTGDRLPANPTGNEIADELRRAQDWREEQAAWDRIHRRIEDAYKRNPEWPR